MISKLAASFSCVILLLICGSDLGMAQNNHQDAIQKFLTPDVIAVGYVDLTKVDLDNTVRLMESFGPEGSSQYRDFVAQMPVFRKELSRIEKACFQRAYVLLRTSDIQEKMTTFVFPLADEATVDATTETLKPLFLKVMGQQAQNYKFDSFDSYLVAGTTSRIAKLKQHQTVNSVDRTEMWKAIGNGTIGIALFGDDDSRRVVRELMPSLPGPFATLSGELIADGIQWAGFSIELDGIPSFNFQIQANEEQHAATVEKVIVDAMKLARFTPQIRQVLPEQEVKLVFDALAPQRSGRRVSMSAGKLTEELPRIAKLISPQLDSMRTRAQVAQLKNRLRQHALGMLNYESAYGHFPPQASVDDDGKPLLSWRVHILPFLQENELYAQFKLDEPWDSPNNFKLVEKMPRIYWNPNSDNFEIDESGKTVFQVAAGKDQLFDVGETSKFKDLSDGSSNTLMVVAMPEGSAVPWTKPTDWQVNVTNPLKPFLDADATSIPCVACDGAVYELEIGSNELEIEKFITPAGGEINVEMSTLSK